MGGGENVSSKARGIVTDIDDDDEAVVVDVLDDDDDDDPFAVTVVDRDITGNTGVAVAVADVINGEWMVAADGNDNDTDDAAIDGDVLVVRDGMLISCGDAGLKKDDGAAALILGRPMIGDNDDDEDEDDDDVTEIL